MTWGLRRYCLITAHFHSRDRLWSLRWGRTMLSVRRWYRWEDRRWHWAWRWDRLRKGHRGQTP